MVNLEGIKMHFYPKLRRMPLRYVKTVIEISPVEIGDPEPVELIKKVFEEETMKITFDTYADIGKT